MTDEPIAMYLPEGDRFVPTRLTEGPWAPHTQGGTATCALLAHVIEQVPTLAPMVGARFTFDLLRPAPTKPLTAESGVLREGKRIQLVQALLRHGEVVVAHGLALRLRIGSGGPDEVENPYLPGPEVPAPPGEVRWPPAVHAELPGTMSAFDVRVPEGPPPSFPNVMWIRQRVPTVAGHPLSPTVALAAAADFVSNSANHVDMRAWSMINADVTLYVVRMPKGEWLAVEARSSFSDDGRGHSRGRLYDLEGPVASAMTAGLVEPTGVGDDAPRALPPIL